MADRRRYTATPRPQLALTGLAATGVAVGWAVAGPVAVGVVAAAWVLGLVAVGLRDRRRWARLVAASGFQPRGTGRADLERLVDGRSVTVETAVVGPLAGSRTVVGTPVDREGTTVVATTEDDGPVTVAGYAVRGERGAVERILAGEVETALAALDLPGTLTVTGERVSYEVPFTGLRAAELDRAAALVVRVARRVDG